MAFFLNLSNKYFVTAIFIGIILSCAVIMILSQSQTPVVTPESIVIQETLQPVRVSEENISVIAVMNMFPIVVMMSKMFIIVSILFIIFILMKGCYV